MLAEILLHRKLIEGERKMVSCLAIARIPLASMLQGTLMVDSIGFRARGNENAASIIQRTGEEDAIE